MPKLTLPENYIYAGKHYGPGEVDIEDEKAYAAIKGKIDAAAKALLTSGPIVSEATVPFSPPAQTNPLAAFESLLAAGYTAETANEASDDELLSVEGVNRNTLKQIRAALK